MTVNADIDPNDPNKIIIIGADWKYNDLFKSIPGGSYRNENGPNGTWRYHLTWQNILALKSTFKHNLAPTDKLKQWTTDLYTNVILPCYTMRTVITPEGWENIMPDVGLFPHQKGDVAFLSTAKRAILANGLGSGKSISVFSAVRQMYQDGNDVFPVLIACPNSTKIGWAKEIQKAWPGVKVTVVDGSAAERKKQLQYVQGNIPCPIHSVTPTEDTTQKDSVEAATNETSGNRIQSTQNGNEPTAEDGLKTSESYQTTGHTSESSTTSHPKSTKSGLRGQNTSANSVLDQQQSLTTGTQTELSVESSVDTATSPPKGRKKTSRGSKKQECTCGSHVVVINWESIRSHSKLAPYGSQALRRCTECKGLDNRIKATSCEAHVKELNEIEFKTVIGDEIHRIKDPASKVARAFKAATGAAPYRFGLSGTPVASNVEDLFSILNWLFPESYPSKNKFIDRFCITAESQWGKTVLGVRPEMETEFFQSLDPFLRRMPKEVILDFLPPVMYQRRDVQMGTKQKKAYEQMRDQMLAEIENGDIVYTTSPLTKLTRMLQFSSSYAELEFKDIYNPVTDSVESKPYVRLADPSCKLDAFMEDLPDYGEESLVIFAVSSQLINMLSARLDKLKIAHGLITGDQDAKTRQMHMDAFQEGKIKYILCTIAAGGTGITLTKGSTAVFLQRSWSMIENIQSEGRVHRIGSEQHSVIKIVDYVTTGSSEEIVFDAVANKTKQLEYILRDKALMEKYLRAEPIPEEKEDE